MSAPIFWQAIGSITRVHFSQAPSQVLSEQPGIAGCPVWLSSSCQPDFAEAYCSLRRDATSSLSAEVAICRRRPAVKKLPLRPVAEHVAGPASARACGGGRVVSGWHRVSRPLSQYLADAGRYAGGHQLWG